MGNSSRNPKKAVVTIRLVPGAAKLSDEQLIKEIEGEMKKAIFVIPWADALESVKIKE
jgi:hypothetical protein